MTSHRLQRSFFPLALLVTGLILPGSVQAATNSNAGTVSLNATLAAALTVTVGSPNVTWTGAHPLVNGAAVVGTGNPTITTTWLLASTNSKIYLYGSFASATAALTDGTDNIPSSAVFGSVTSNASSGATPTTTLTAFTQTPTVTGVGTASGSLLLDTYTITSANFVNLTGIVDTLTLSITAPAQQAAGYYSGTITIQAQAD